MSVDLGFIGSLSQAKAAKAATQAQMRAIKEQRKFLFENLDPAAMQPAVLAADIENFKQQRALQEQMDPALAARLGVSIKLITGDSQLVARHVAGLVGLSAREHRAEDGLEPELAVHLAGGRVRAMIEPRCGTATLCGGS
jgi:hypothetical protein